jgi:hypothetical protein
MPLETATTARIASAAVDSRDYAFAYLLRSRKDLPGDFPLPEGADGFSLGLFLPMDRPSPVSAWRAPARIVLLDGNRLTVAFHPSEQVTPEVFALDAITVLEFGRLLLRSWMRIVTPRGTQFLPYHTRDHENAEPFFTQLRNLFLPEESAIPLGVFGAPSDSKVWYAERAALARRTPVQLRFSSPSIRQQVKGWWISAESWLPTQHIALTSKSLLWITDRMEWARDPYGTVTRYGRLTALRGTRFTNRGATAELGFEFSDTPIWNIEVPGEHADAPLAFLEAFHSCRLWPIRSAGRCEL